MPKTDLIAELSQLVSESRNADTAEMDLMSTAEIVAAINRQDHEVPAAVGRVLPQIAEAVDKIVAAFRAGGRLVYLGAGTSGRLGVLDASECPPTFGVPPSMVVGLIAGGDHALRHPIEGAEDDAAQGRADLETIRFSAADIVVGIAVSGRTPYVIGGLDYAKSLGATTISLTCNPNSPIAAMADIAISPVVGPEVVTGSTRLKSGTAQKLVLNMLSTASMIRIGKTYQNLMVDVSVSNEKLAARAIRIITDAIGCSAAEAEDYLAQGGGKVKLAILIGLTGLSRAEAETALAKADGFHRRAIETARS